MKWEARGSEIQKAVILDFLNMSQSDILFPYKSNTTTNVQNTPLINYKMRRATLPFSIALNFYLSKPNLQE